MTIQIDSREKARAIKNIVAEFDKQKINYFVSKLYVGDYMNYDNPRVIIDRKQNLTELCANVCQQHDRFRAELLRAKEAGIKIIILCEHSKNIKCLEDVIWWENPRKKRRVKDKAGRWVIKETKAIEGGKLYKILATMQNKYDCKFLFCDKGETGRKIIEILNCQEG